MVALYGGQETIPGQVDHPVPLTVEQVNIATQQGWLSPEESQALYDETQRLRAEELEKQRLAEMQRKGKDSRRRILCRRGRRLRNCSRWP